MKKAILFGVLILMLCSLVAATRTIVWTETFSDINNETKSLPSKSCGGASDVEWTTVTWTDGSTNATNCVDTARCRDGTGGWTAWKTSGQSLSMSADKINCQWNLTVSVGGEDNCTVSAFHTLCGGYVEDYKTSDVDNVVLDFVGLLLAGLVTIGGLFALVMLWVYFKKKNIKF